MKRTKKSMIVIGVILAVIFSFTCFTACDLAGLTGELSGGGKTTDDTPKTAKVDFSEAAENFEKKDTKKTSIELKFKSTVFTQQSAQGKNSLVKENYNLGSTLTVDRIQDKDKIFLSSKLALSDTDQQVSSLIETIADMVANTLNNNKDLSGTGNQLSDTLDAYVAPVVDYLNGQVDLNAALGVKNGVYNLKASYSDKTTDQSGDVWFVADEKAIHDWLNNTADIEISENVMQEFMMKTVFSQLKKTSSYFGKDNASKYVDSKKGTASYDISIKANTIINDSLISLFLDLAGVKDKAKVLADYAEYFDELKNWFSLTTDNVCADVNKDNLPQKITTGVYVDLNINSAKVKSFLNKLYTDGVVDLLTVQLSKFAVNSIQDYLCGTNGETDRIGIRFSLGMTETFTYGLKECSLGGDKYSDYFLAADVEAEGRRDLAKYVAGIVEDVDVYVANKLASLGEEYADDIEAIRTEVNEKIAELKASGVENVTVVQIGSIFAEVLIKYQRTPEENTDEPSKPSENGDEETKSKADEIRDQAGNLIDKFGDLIGGGK